MGSSDCQDLIDCIGTGALESCAKFTPSCTSPKVGEDTAKILHEGLQLEMHGSKANGLYIARYEGSVYILRRRAEYPDMSTLLAFAPSGRVETIGELVEPDSRSFYRVWHAATADQLSQSTCGDLGRCLTKEADARACAEATRTCMLHAPRGRLCEGQGGTLELKGRAAVPLLSCFVRGEWVTHGSDESSFYIVSNKRVGHNFRYTLLIVPRDSSGAASAHACAYPQACAEPRLFRDARRVHRWQRLDTVRRTGARAVHCNEHGRRHIGVRRSGHRALEHHRWKRRVRSRRKERVRARP